MTRLLRKDEPIPYDLLLLADEFVEVIDKYIFDSEIYVYEEGDRIIALYALYKVDSDEVEIKYRHRKVFVNVRDRTRQRDRIQDSFYWHRRCNDDATTTVSKGRI